MKKYIVFYTLKGLADQCRLLARSAQEAKEIVQQNLPRTCRVSVVLWQQ